MAKMLAASIPPISRELYEQLTSVFRPITPMPNEHTLEDIMYNAGAVAVVEWIRVHALAGSTVTGQMPDVSESINMRQS